MVYQSGRNVSVAYKEETTFGTLAGTGSGKTFRPNSGNITLSKEPINSNENRNDGMMTRGRHGSRSVSGSYVGDLSVGSYDDWIEAVFRGTFDAPLELDESDFTSITTGANTIILASGNPITLGVRYNDVIQLAGHSSTGNNGRNLRVTGLSATTITVAETLTVNAVADTDAAITRSKKVIQGVEPRSFTIEERETDIDGSEVFTGCRISQMQLSLQPNSMATVNFSIIGQDGAVMTGAESPYFLSPTTTSTIGLTAVEAVIRLGTEDVLDISSLELTINLNAAPNFVVGSNVTPDVFTNLAAVEGTITALKSDVTRMQQFLDEDELSLHLMFQAPGSTEFCAFSIPNLTLASVTKSELGSDGARTSSFSLLIGKDLRGGAYDPTMVAFQTSAS